MEIRIKIVISKLIFEDKWAKYDMVKLCFTRYLLLSLLFNVVGNKLKRFWKNLEMSYCHENRYFLYFYPTSNLEPRKCWGNERFAIWPEQVCPAASPCWALSRSTPINAEPHISSLWAGGCECALKMTILQNPLDGIKGGSGLKPGQI